MPIQKIHNVSKLKTIRKFSRNLLLTSMFSLPMVGQTATPVSLGGVLTVNTEIYGEQQSTKIESLSNGNNLIYWYSSYDSEAKKPGLFAQLFSPDGLKIGTEISLNAEDGQVVALEDGGFLLVRLTRIENHYHGAATTFAIQRFNDAGGLIGTESKFNFSEGNSIPINHINSFDLERLSNNKVLISIDADQVYQKAINIGDVLTAEEPILVGGDQHHYTDYKSKVITLPNGDYVIAWVKQDNHSNGYSTFAQIYDVNSTPKGDILTIGSPASAGPYNLSIAALKGGGFVLTKPNDEGNTVAHLYTNEGASRGSEIIIPDASPVHSIFNSKVAAFQDGRFIVLWTFGINHEPEKLYGQVYNPNGTKSGETFLISHEQWFPEISQINHNHFIVAADSMNSNGFMHDNDVVAQLYKLDAQPANKLIATTPTRSIFVGNTFEIPLSIEGSNIYGVDTVLSMNGTQVAQFSDGLYGEFLPSYERLTIPVNVTGERWESALSLKSPYKEKTGKGHYGTASLIATNPGTVTVTVQSQFTDENGQYIYQSQDNYTVTVLESVLISGSVASLAPDGDFSNFTITINGEIVKINPDGSFSIQAGIGEATLTFSAPGYLSKEQNITLSPNQANVDLGEIDLVAGDSNGNDKIDIGDLTKLLGAYRTTSTDPNYSIGVDFNRDNKVDLQDLTLLGKNFGKQAQ
ncbi:hypothetical protein N473_03105 [Pseudoalteromonas luteoviolacea CPMOR-1]|uniref:Dockerin domain-containing protein n=1 Tax=Pseudoalteromonas luteoviolacea CPMOR-1 TaxID=1365248 RepID=A0A167IBP8_9GAMM|nr:hypothetical protein [Pseudoalteromonas luteoviolacea]KZN59158.1 hypothetical protein N473_03105 [Pseudoalteromonas luteoviolacea CPMOR-1]